MDLLEHADRPSSQRPRRAAAVALTLLSFLAAAGGLAWWVQPAPPVAPRPVVPTPRVTEPAAAPAPAARAVLQTRSLADWLGDIASESGLGLVAGPELSRKVTAVFPPSTPWQERLDALVRSSELTYAIADGMIELTAAPAAPVRLPAAGDSADDPPAKDAGAAAERSETTMIRIQPRHAGAADLAKVLSRLLQPRGVGAAADPASNSLLLSGRIEDVEGARRIVEQMDVPYRRFLVEAQIVEMASARRSDLGVQWKIEGDDFTAAANFPTGAADGREGEITIATGGTVALRARISALEADGRARVVARPRVLVVEGRPASIESVRILRVRLPDSTSVVAGGEDTRATAQSRAVEEFPVGITLKVEPSLLGGDRVALRVTAKSSTLGEPLPPDDIPEEFSRLVQADFFVSHGETAVLGGLARAATSGSRAGVPLLRDIPGLGVLFGRRIRERGDEELVVLVTPFLLD
jgi:type II secretory pathway component HofQ